MGMENIHVKRLDGLREILENPDMYPIYEHFVPGKVVNARVDMYEHPNGLTIEGKPGRWWLYVSVESMLSKELVEPITYDIALWKLFQYRRESDSINRLFKEGILEMREVESSGEKVSVDV